MAVSKRKKGAETRRSPPEVKVVLPGRTSRGAEDGGSAPPDAYGQERSVVRSALEPPLKPNPSVPLPHGLPARTR